MESEQIKPEELETHVRNGTFRLAFIGMSNAGKTYRSKVLRDELNFIWFHVDGEIVKELGFTSTEEVFSWLEQPMSDGYKEREAQYLELENRFTKNASMQTNGRNLVFDTTGSVVNLDDSTVDTLRENCLVVHLDVGEDSLSRMVEKYFEQPKPVAWCWHFNQKPGETTEEAFQRCYPKLIEYRLERYRQLAHVDIPVHEVRDKSAKETLEVIKRHL